MAELHRGAVYGLKLGRVSLVAVPYQASQRNSKGHRHVIGNRNDEHMWRAASWKNIARNLSLRWMHRAVRLRHRDYVVYKT
jgi:hypothetical protein